MANAQWRWEAPDQWDEWSEWLAAGLHARNRWRLPLLFLGMLFANGRRTVTTWLRAAGISDDFQDYYYFLAAVGRKINPIATRLVILILETLPLPKRLLVVLDATHLYQGLYLLEQGPSHAVRPQNGSTGQPVRARRRFRASTRRATS